MSESQNARAQRLRNLHVPGNPVVLTNVYDGETTRIVLQQPRSPAALATSSYAVAAVRGKSDEDLEPDMLVRAAHDIMGVVKAQHQSASSALDAEKLTPLSIDMRDGWGEQLETVVSGLIGAGVVGCNLEDEDGETGELMPLDRSVDRVRRVCAEAARCGVPAFAVNARTDVLGHGRSIDDAIARGKAYLDAGALSVFVWGGLGGRGVSRDEVATLVGALGGKLNARLKTGPGYLTVTELKELGVSRISLGKELMEIAMGAYGRAVAQILA